MFARRRPSVHEIRKAKLTSPHFETLLSSITAFSARVGVIGLGYVGLPLAIAAARAGFAVTGFDIDPNKIVALDAGKSYIAAVSDAALAKESSAGRFRSTTDFQKLAGCDVIIICVPTPLTKHRDPDLSFVEKTSRAIAATLRPAQLIVLESTTYPGTTDGVVRTILEETGLKSGSDFFVGFSPEREDPGNPTYETVSIPKVVAGDGPQASALMERFYAAVVKTVVPVSSNATAEAVKLTENIFRSVNIALVNELKIVYEAMGIDVWEVIEAAKTKPFGYMRSTPARGLAATAFRSTPSTSPGSRGNSNCLRASSSLPARSIRPCPAMWLAAWPRPSTARRARRSAVPTSSSSASPTRRMFRTFAKARRCA
jgi:UDP-N-acetyl-D-glucosamine dehydrogenase